MSRHATESPPEREAPTRTPPTEYREFAERLLQEDRERLLRVLNASRDAMIAIGPDSRITLFNTAAERIFGWRAGEVLGCPVGVLMPAEVAPRHQEYVDSFFRCGRPNAAVDRTVELVARHRDGHEFPVELSLAADREGRYPFALAVVRDVTDRKKLEEAREAALRRQLGITELQRRLLAPAGLEEKLRDICDGVVRLFDADFCGIWLIRPGDLCERGCAHADAHGGPPACPGRQRCLHLLASAGRYTHANGPVHQRIPFGYWKVGQVVLDPTPSFLTNDPLNDPAIRDHAWAREFGLAAFAVHALRLRDGEPLGVLALFARHPISADEDAMLSGLTNTVSFVVQQSAAEAELRREHARTEQLLAAISSILIGLDGGDRITEWNRRAEAAFGIEAANALGRNLGECGIPWDCDPVMRGIRECRRRHEPVRVDDVRFRRRDGSDGYLALTISVVGGDAGQGETPGLLVVGTDITERRTLEAQLVQAQKLESIGQLAAGIAHEINTPTQFVGDNNRFLQDAFADIEKLLEGYARVAEAARAGTVPQELLARVEEIAQEIDLAYLRAEIPKAIGQSLDGVDRVARIVRAMKEFSHPGSQEKQETDLNKAIETTITVARNEWKYVAEMVTDFDPALPPVPCLAGEFNQVVLNLITNAAHAIAAVVKDGAKEKGRITIRTRRDGDWAEVRVSDTGTGIPEAVRPRVFDPFFTTKGVGKGTGQGLAIARSVVVKKHGGTIDFETEMGKGTTFIIRLPITPQAGQAPEPDRDHEEAHSVC